MRRTPRTNGLSGTTPATARARLDTVLLHVRPVCMARPWVDIHSLVSIILLPLVLVHDAHANRRSQRNAKLSARLDFHPVLLIAGSCDCALTRSSARHLGLDVRLCEGHARRAAIHYAPHRQAVGLAVAVQNINQSWSIHGLRK